jgi:N-methylhydantoinase A
LPLPTVDVHTVGCGGGSIAYCDAGKALRVGPESAGADPGPACYGKGTEPTVTDAHMALGHMGPDTLLGGGFPVDVDRSVRAIERLGKRLGLSAERTARGILEIADVHMVRALMYATVERAIDPATVPLVAYGGAGGLHAASLAQRLGMPLALVPPHPGAFSALGLALAGESIERVDAVRATLSDRTERDVRARARDLAARARRELGQAGRVSVDIVLRYQGQGGGLRLPLRRGALLQAFLAAHQQRFGFAPTDRPVEVTQLVARAETAGHPFPRSILPRGSGPLRARQRRAPVGKGTISVLLREELHSGCHVLGPAIVEEPTAATRIPAGCVATVTPEGLRVTNLSD